MRGRRSAGAAGLAFALLTTLPVLAGSCRGTPPIDAPEGGTVAVDPDTALVLQRRADGFYLRLANRRFNTLETYSDRIMREHFESQNLFLDYYAELAQALVDAHFEKSRPRRVEVLGFVFEDPTRARVQVRFVGDDGRPLRPGRAELVRTDRWQQRDGAWWIQPGKL